MQAILPLKLLPKYEVSDFFVSQCNVEAYRMIAEENIEWPNNRLIIKGERGSGKSHLAYIWLKKNPKAKALSCKNNCGTLFSASNEDGSYLVIEDIDNLLTLEQEYLFMELINIAVDNNSKLLMTCRKTPEFRLPDLRSRFKATYSTIIHNPDNEIIEVLLRKHLHDKQLKMKESMIQRLCYYVSSNNNKSFAYLQEIIENLDKIALLQSPKFKLNYTMLKKLVLMNEIRLSEI